jgi:hypothetical protein
MKGVGVAERLTKPRIAPGDVLRDEDLLAPLEPTRAGGEPFTRQWKRDGEPIAGADWETYTLTQDDVGSVITVTATRTDDQGSIESVTSDPTSAVTRTRAGGELFTSGDTQRLVPSRQLAKVPVTAEEAKRRAEHNALSKKYRHTHGMKKVWKTQWEPGDDYSDDEYGF